MDTAAAHPGDGPPTASRPAPERLRGSTVHLSTATLRASPRFEAGPPRFLRGALYIRCFRFPQQIAGNVATDVGRRPAAVTWARAPSGAARVGDRAAAQPAAPAGRDLRKGPRRPIAPKKFQQSLRAEPPAGRRAPPKDAAAQQGSTVRPRQRPRRRLAVKRSSALGRATTDISSVAARSRSLFLLSPARSKSPWLKMLPATSSGGAPTAPSSAGE